jgi:ubiquinone/menaquinone biosynthesis C-methylase UbiE
MKGRESGMPDEDYWQTFFDVDCILDRLECVSRGDETIVEFGSGYGTFTLPAAARTSGTIHALDIEPRLVELVDHKAGEAGLGNVNAVVRDFVAEGTGLPSESVDHAMLFNILHIEDPVSLLKEAYRVAKPGGIVSVIHWKHDPSTPRGPSMSIRPRPEVCRAWGERAGLIFIRYQDLSECCRHHYGVLLARPDKQSNAE